MEGYVLTIAYDGTAYCGWQVQPHGDSVQARIQDSCEAVFGLRPNVTGCSRTDAGVHAKGFVALVSGDFTVPAESLPVAMNRHLPADIAVLSARYAEKGFHPRYDAKGKEYVYSVLNSRVRDPFSEKYCWLFPRRLDEDRLAAAASEFVGTHDFRAFMAVGSKISDTVRTVYSFTVGREGDMLRFTVSADGFLYNMVRIMVGTAVAFASGTRAPAVHEIIGSCDRSNAGMTAPAKGLCLNRVFY